MAQALPLELLEPDDGEAHRVCSCGLEAPDDGVRVRCPKHGPIARWGVTVRGMVVYRCPKGAGHRRIRDLTA